MTLTCNKKAYEQFRVECNKCPMKTECIDNGKSVAVGLMEQPTININVNFMHGTEKPTVEEIANRISDMLKDEISGCLRM